MCKWAGLCFRIIIISFSLQHGLPHGGGHGAGHGHVASPEPASVATSLCVDSSCESVAESVADAVPAGVALGDDSGTVVGARVVTGSGVVTGHSGEMMLRRDKIFSAMSDESFWIN
eukprot:Gregarina_sp_Pseudo_9__2383@NODE_2688_length_910_cov_1585_802526_g1217_i1_p3_GENE_NODE_2688_length_910_cov_1585_802526_g1217_i1NODE_2688_length_910_cov_1585_802526_g1217_i1_p3_ORF_typecomplete_len116_score1_30DUF3224/PF11528_8/0_055_NODE_2688_length_910_cov_1585_802526_g1217_i1521868